MANTDDLVNIAATMRDKCTDLLEIAYWLDMIRAWYDAQKNNLVSGTNWGDLPESVMDGTGLTKAQFADILNQVQPALRDFLDGEAVATAGYGAYLSAVQATD